MQSFYGGRQGISFIIKKQFATVAAMNEFFAKGAETTSEVGYGEYVVINTNYSKASGNGDVYMRGFEGAEGPVCNILGPMGNTPAITVESRDEVAEYILEHNTEYTEEFPDTWVHGEGSWGSDNGDTVTVYQFITDESIIITQEEYDNLSTYGKSDYKESDTISYIKVIKYYIHDNGVNIITKDTYKTLSDDDKAYYSLCYVNRENEDIRINQATYDSLSAEGKAEYKLYQKSDSTNILTEEEVEQLPEEEQEDYEECYVDKVYGTSFISLTEYNELSAAEKANYNPYVTIFYLIEDPSKKISIYVYDNLTTTGKNSYKAITYQKNRGIYRPSHTSNSYIYYAYANVLDEDGNVQSCLIGFSFPYYEENFYLQSVSPYKADGTIYTDDDELSMTIHDNKNFNYYKEWNLTVPRGVQGSSISAVFITVDYAKAGTEVYNYPETVLDSDLTFTSFVVNQAGFPVLGCGYKGETELQIKLSDLDTSGQEFYYWVELTDYTAREAGDKTYKKVGLYQSIKRVTVAESNGEGYSMHDLLILYSDETLLGDITYDGVTGWVNAGNTRGKIQGLRVFAVFDSIDDFDAAKSDSTGYQYSPEELAERLGVEDADNCGGWGVIAINPELTEEGEQTASVYYYDYGTKRWKRCASSIGSGLADPTSVIFIGDESQREAADDALSEDGYWFKTETIHRAY